MREHDEYYFENYNDRYTSLAPVGQFNPNSFGLYDMTGNVFEYCQDHFHSSYQGAPSNGSAWITPDSSNHVIKGGGFMSGTPSSRVSYRIYSPIEHVANGLGFRLARSR